LCYHIKQVQGLYNRLTEANIDNIATEIRKLYGEHSRHGKAT